MFNSRSVCFLFIITGIITGCSESSDPEVHKEAPVSLVSANAAIEVETDPRISQIYERACKACHSTPATGAPVSGDAKAWKPRLAKGMDTLVESAINGSGAMPPLGLCMECDEDDFRALISFMAKQ